jgi:hypothetical protein
MLQNDSYCYIKYQKFQRKIVKMYQSAHDMYHHWLSRGVARRFLVRQRQKESKKIRVHWQEMSQVWKMPPA